MSDDSEKETKYTIITGNPVAGFDLYGIFDSHAEAFEYADSRMRLPDDWSIMAINAVQPEREDSSVNRILSLLAKKVMSAEEGETK